MVVKTHMQYNLVGDTVIAFQILERKVQQLDEMTFMRAGRAHRISCHCIQTLSMIMVVLIGETP